MNTTLRQSAAFPVVAILRKGGPKIKKGDRETMGSDLNDRFRVDWLPGVDPAVRQMFTTIYKTDQPHSLHAMIPFRNVWEAWSTTNEAYWGAARFAQADQERYVSLYNPFTWEPLVVRGEPFKPFIPGELLTFENKKGEPQAFKVKPTTRFDLFLPELTGFFVTFQIKTSSSGDLINLRRNLAAIQVAADALGQRTGAAGIPIVVSRREDTVQWHKGPGQVVPVKKWLIDIRPDSSSRWAQTFAERLSALALSAPLAVDEDPEDESDYGDDGEGGAESTPPAELEIKEPAAELEDTKPVPVAKPNVPKGTLVQEEAEEGRVLITAPAGEPEQTVDPLRPRSASDYSGFWVTVVPKMADAHKDIPAQKVKELSKAAMVESGNDAIKAYDLLRQKIAAASPV